MENVIIIGSGPAGWTAAIYASRANLQPLLFEGSEPGGQLTTTTDVENYPGFPNGIMGPELMELFKKQAVRFGTRVQNKHVTAVDLKSSSHKVKVGEETFETKTIIISTGASARRLGLQSEKQLYGRGVSACATCDGPLFRGKKEVVVVGGGDSAMEESLFLTKFVDHATIVVRSDSLKASKIMQERAKKNPKISFVWNTEVVDILDSAQGKVVAVKFKNNKTNEMTEHPSDGLFTAIGHVPNTQMFVDQLELDRGYIVTSNFVSTKIPGVYACGDVMDPRYRQAVTAAGTGCMAALEAEKFLNEKY